MSDVTLILSAIEQGDAGAASQLLPLIYDELRKLAARKLASEPPEQTLDATALVHEAYLRLVATPQRESGKQLPWNSRGHFFAAAAEAMRRILVENARRKKRLKHGGGRERVNFEAVASLAPEQSEDLEALDEALSKLAVKDPGSAELVNLRYFGGLTMAEIAEVLGVSLATVERKWTYARTWLFAEMTNRDNSPAS